MYILDIVVEFFGFLWLYFDIGEIYFCFFFKMYFVKYEFGWDFGKGEEEEGLEKLVVVSIGFGGICCVGGFRRFFGGWFCFCLWLFLFLSVGDWIWIVVVIVFYLWVGLGLDGMDVDL